MSSTIDTMTQEDAIQENGYFYGMSWFGAFRNHYGFTQYGDNRTAVTIDFPLVTVAYLCILLAVATLISTLGIRGRERWTTTLRASYAVGIGSIILACLVGHNWMTGSADIQSRYLYRSNKNFRGTVGLRISLHSCNVTLEGTYNQQHGRGSVYYAESMEWTDYGKEHEMIGFYLKRGVPHPVMTVMDFLSFDSGGLRWGRDLHSAGYFAEALLWTAFAFWVISNVLLMSVVVYGAFLFSMTGVAMVLACVVYHVCQPSLPLRIEFGDSLLTTHYGWCFWLCLISGITTTCLGALLFVLDHLFHEKVAEFFGQENLNDCDLPDFSPSTLPFTNPTNDKLNESSLQFRPSAVHATRHGSLQGFGSRRGSFQAGGAVHPQRPNHHCPAGGQRKGSIFLEPERRPSDFTSGVRHHARGVTFGGGLGGGPSQTQQQQQQQLQQQGGGLTGFSNKAFEQDRGKTNPLFCSGLTPRGIQEESGDEGAGSSDNGREPEVRIDVTAATSTSAPTSHTTNTSGSVVSTGAPAEEGGAVARGAYDNRKPSLATMREHRENHMNERQQFQSTSASGKSPFTFTTPSGPTSVIVHANTSEPTSQPDVRAGEEGRGGMTGLHIGYDGTTADSAFASAAASPADSERNSTCGDVEENRL